MSDRLTAFEAVNSRPNVKLWCLIHSLTHSVAKIACNGRICVKQSNLAFSLSCTAKSNGRPLLIQLKETEKQRPLLLIKGPFRVFCVSPLNAPSSPVTV